MKTVVYDPINGEAIPDGSVMDFALNLPEKGIVTVSNEIVFLAIRVLIIREQLDYKDIQFMYKEEVLSVNEKGRPSHWPNGFCDLSEQFLEAIFGL